MNSIPEKFEKGINFQKKGDFKDAESIIDRAKQNGIRSSKFEFLSEQISNRRDSLSPSDSLLKKLFELYQNQKYKEAEKLALSITEQFPNHPFAWKTLAVIMSETGRISEGVTASEIAINIEPKDLETLSNLTIMLKNLGRLKEAEAYYRQLINLNSSSKYHNKFGEFLIEVDRLEEAKIHIEKAIDLEPEFAAAHNNLGNIYYKYGNYKEAIESYNKTIRIDPNFAEAYNNLGVSQKELTFLEEAEEKLKKAIKINPDFAEAYNNLGLVQFRLGKYADAEVSYLSAIKLKPNYAGAYSNLGNTLMSFLKLKEAAKSFNKSVELEPESNPYHHQKLFSLNYSRMWSLSQVYEEHLEFEKQFGGLDIRTPLDYKNFKHSGDKLRIGYVSGDFKSHSVSYFFEPLLEHHNASVVETFCYYNNTPIDGTTRRLMALSDHWRPIFSISDTDVVKLIKKDKIDILVDLAGHTANNRLLVFAQKPAPIQVTWLGYPNTTGLSAIDYRFTDMIADPVGEADDFHSETLFRLPNGFQCYKGNENINVNTDLPQNSRGYITFGSFNNLAKMTFEVINVWAKILKAVPNSKLIIKSSIFNTHGQHYIGLFEEEGIAADRIEFHNRVSDKNEHLEFYNKIDICLDTFCFNGATTTCEALWMGVPVITLLGDRHVGRVGASILTNIGLTDFIAQDIDDYVALASKMSNRPEYLKEIRQRLRKQMLSSPLCNGQSFARDVEDSYKDMWKKYLKTPINNDDVSE